MQVIFYLSLNFQKMKRDLNGLLERISIFLFNLLGSEWKQREHILLIIHILFQIHLKHTSLHDVLMSELSRGMFPTIERHPPDVKML